MAKNTVPLTASGQAVPAGKGNVLGLMVNNHSSGIVRLVDAPNGAAGRTIFGGTGGYTLPSGSSVIELPSLEYYEGIYFILVSGTVDVQVMFEPLFSN